MTTETVPTTIDATELWSAVQGSSWEQFSWWISYQYLDGAKWDIPGRVSVTVEDPNNDGATITKVIGVEDLVRAWSACVEAGNRDACTGSALDVEDVDACVGDTVMQVAVLGESVYA